MNQAKAVPGAGTYDLPSKLVEGPAFVMGLKLDNQSSIGAAVGKTIKNPGPNVYQPKFNSVKKAAPSFSLKSRYDVQKGDKVPGPGTYEGAGGSPKKRPASYVFGKSPQRESAHLQKSPGPQTYHIPCSIGNMPQYTGARPEKFAYI